MLVIEVILFTLLYRNSALELFTCFIHSVRIVSNAWKNCFGCSDMCVLSLYVANSSVRANAATLLVGAVISVCCCCRWLTAACVPMLRHFSLRNDKCVLSL